MRSVVLALAVIAAVVVAFLLTRRGPGATPPPAAPIVVSTAQPRTALRWMGHWLGEDQRETLVREMAREFAFLHPDIDVVLRFPAEIMGERSKRLTADLIVEQIAKERPEWDVVWIDDVIYQHVADRLGDPSWGGKHLVDFRTVPGFAEAHKPFILQDPTYAAQTGGILVGPYIEGQYIVLWQNRELASRLGLGTLPGQPHWSDLIALAEQLRAARLAGRTDAWLLTESKDWLTTQYLFQSLVSSRFPDVAHAQSSDPDPAKRAAVREAVLAFAELGRHEPLRPGHRETLWIDTRRLPLDDQSLCFVAGTWMYSHWRGLDAARMARMVPLRLPGFAPVDHAIGGYIPTWGVLAKAPGREAGIALLRHWCSADVAERWVAYTKNPTGLRGDLANVALSKDPFDRFMIAMERSTGSRIGRASSPAYALGTAGENQSDAFHEVLRGLLAAELSAEEGWQRICALAGWEPAQP